MRKNGGNPAIHCSDSVIPRRYGFFESRQRRASEIHAIVAKCEDNVARARKMPLKPMARLRKRAMSVFLNHFFPKRIEEDEARRIWKTI